MKHLHRYLSILFLQRLVIAVLAMVALLGVLDALGNADKLPDGAGFAGQMRYMWLRLPILFDRTIVFALLLAVLLTYASLFRRNELVIISAAGVSIFGQIRILMPVVFLAGIVSAVVIDRASPPASAALQNWLGSEAMQEDSQTPERLWLSDGPRLIELQGLQDDVLSGITIFERDASGAVIAITTAETARHVKGGWELANARHQRFDAQEIQAEDFWPSPQTPSSLRKLLTEPRDMSFSDLLTFNEMRGSGSRPSSAYLLWALNRLSLPLTCLGFLILAVPIMQLYGRRDSSDMALASGVAAGFAFMVVDGVLKTLAENGNFSAIAAVLLPTVGLMLVGVWLALQKEERK